MLCDPSFTTYLSALFTPVLAVFGILIARRQHLTALNKLRLDLFDRRYAVYEATENFIGGFCAYGKVKEGEELKFLCGTSKSQWLFNVDIKKYLNEIRLKAFEHDSLKEDLGGLSSEPERDQYRAKEQELWRWVREQLDSGLAEKLGPFLHISAE